MDEDKEQNNGL